MKLKITILFLLLFAGKERLNAQNITLEQTISFINSKFGPACKIDVKNGYLLAEFYDQNGTIIRKDKGDIEFLEVLQTKFASDEKMIYLFCNQGDCVERKLMGNTKVTRLYDRYPFVWEGDAKTAESLVKAFNHLIRLINEPEYKIKTHTSFE